MSTRDDGLSWRFALNGGAYCRGEQAPASASPSGAVLASACAAARGAVDRIQRPGGDILSVVEHADAEQSQP